MESLMLNIDYNVQSEGCWYIRHKEAAGRIDINVWTTVNERQWQPLSDILGDIKRGVRDATQKMD